MFSFRYVSSFLQAAYPLFPRRLKLVVLFQPEPGGSRVLLMAPLAHRLQVNLDKRHDLGKSCLRHLKKLRLWPHDGVAGGASEVILAPGLLSVSRVDNYKLPCSKR